MLISLTRCRVRSFRAGDVTSLTHHANNRAIWLHLRDRFPHPYRRRDAVAFIRHVLRSLPETSFAIDVDGEAVGAIGLMLRDDVERVSAEIGYWIGEAWWGRGIVSEAVAATTRYALETFGLTRIYAVPFAENAASCRVLEKAGYVLEGQLRRSAIKDGVIKDQLQYAFIP